MLAQNHTNPTTDAVVANQCPLCSQQVTAANRMVGEVLSCEGCSAELEVVGVNPLRLEEAPEVEEDWGE
ncbi:lysine biosynthesis protein LysW [Corallococcus sicarius]|uniref:Lysine biosynthesis protein LysW n=1 Tax=Corallococcus sicarius TaxID=2316726 RepID=A0A3A8N6V1_9BACT|nr:lysine biosynthesis protein LysW [Corallococcus sicarius]RKH40147.1 lysine biosynthesis protein LysW [Corallococcus sicarius]